MSSEFHFDFLCVGFNKSGTTSLDRILRNSPQIRLPFNKKEIMFYAWKNNYMDPITELQKKFFPDYPYEGQLVGSIDPSYCMKPAQVMRDFGKETKLIFMMRNPINATYSYFKMYLRYPREYYFTEMYRKYGNNVQDMFSDYIRRFILTDHRSDFFYRKNLEPFLAGYPRERIHFIVFEDFIADQQKETDRLTDFLGVDRIVLDQKYTENEGSFIPKNYLCARAILRQCVRKTYDARRIGNNEEKMTDSYRELVRFLSKEYLEPMSERNRRMLREIYRKDVEAVSDILGREDLKELWN